MQDIETEKYRLELIKHIAGALVAAGRNKDEVASLALSTADAVIKALAAEKATRKT